MGSLTQGGKSSNQKNFKARTKKKSNTNYSQFEDEFEVDNYPQLNLYKKQDYRLSKRKDFRGDFDQA